MKSRKLICIILALLCAVCLAVVSACGGGNNNESGTRLAAILITAQPDKKDYVEGETFDKTGMVVTAKYSDNETAEVTDYTVSPAGALTKDVTKVTVSYTEKSVTKTADVAITVRADSNLVDLEVLARPVKVDYLVGEELELRGLTLLAKYGDGTTREITSGYVCSKEGTLTLDDLKITVSYTERGITKTAQFNISVKEPVIFTSLEVTTPPTTTAYAEGEMFSPAGMVVSAVYSDGSRKEVTDYTYPLEGLHKDATKVTLSYTEDGITKTVDVNITIKKYLESISASGTHNFKVGDVFTKDWIKVTGHYSDSSTIDIEDFTVNKSGQLTLEDNGTEVEISVGSMKANVTLTVTDYTGEAFEMGIEGAEGTQVDDKSSDEAKAFIEQYKYKEGLNNNADGIAFRFNSSAAQKVKVEVVMAANEAGDMLLKDIFDISINGVKLTDELNGITVFNPDKIAYYYFGKIVFSITVTEGDNTLRFVSNSGRGTNLAGVILVSEDESKTIGAMTTPIYRIEAEHAELIGTPTDGIGFVAANKPNNSNNRTIGWTPLGMQVKFVVNSDKATTAKFTVCLASTYNGTGGNIEVSFKNAWKTTINGVESDKYNDIMIIPSDKYKQPIPDGADHTPWYNDYVVVEFEIDLTEGENVIVLEKVGGSNDLDYVEITANAVLTWTDVPNPDRP